MLRAVTALIVALFFLVGCTSAASTSRAERGSLEEESTSEPIDPSDDLNVEPGAVIAPTPTPDGPRPLTVVTLLNETNIAAPFDARALAGVVAEVDRLNDEGGVLGREVRLVRFDTNSRVSLTVRTAERLVENPPDLIIASCDILFAEPVLEIADQAGIVTISPCGDDVRYLTGGFGPRNFTLGAPAEARGALAAQAAIDRYGSSAIVLRDVTSPEALAFCNGFERTFRELGGSVAYRDEFSYESLEPVQDRLAERGRETSVIVVCSHIPGEYVPGNPNFRARGAPDIITMVRTLGFQAPIISGTGVDQPGWFPQVPTLGELLFVSWSSVYGNDPDDSVNELVERVRDVSDPLEDPLLAGVSTVLGSEAVQAWARAVEAARSEAPDRVAAALGSFNDEPFSTGTVSYVSGARMDLGRTYRIIEVKDGELSVIALETTDE